MTVPRSIPATSGVIAIIRYAATAGQSIMTTRSVRKIMKRIVSRGPATAIIAASRTAATAPAA
jgi:hypothetical protein